MANIRKMAAPQADRGPTGGRPKRGVPAQLPTEVRAAILREVQIPLDGPRVEELDFEATEVRLRGK